MAWDVKYGNDGSLRVQDNEANQIPISALDATGNLTIGGTLDVTGAFSCAALSPSGAITHTGTTVGFNSATPVAKASGTADIKDSLVALGLITDSGASPLDLDGGALTVGAAICTTLAPTGLVTVADLSFGTAEDATVATGVLTVTQSNVNVLPESGTTDTVDSITWSGVAEGAILLCRSEDTNTITFDNSATMLLGAGTRAVAPGGCIMFIYHGTTWVELSFLAAAS